MILHVQTHYDGCPYEHISEVVIMKTARCQALLCFSEQHITLEFLN